MTGTGKTLLIAREEERFAFTSKLFLLGQLTKFFKVNLQRKPESQFGLLGKPST
jgi:hypothetical protein